MIRKAIGSMVDEETMDIDLVGNLKPGDGRICIEYYLDDAEYPFGCLTAYSNGGICVNIDKVEYGDVIYKDYLLINGDNPLPRQEMIDSYEMPIISVDYDVERWKRAKKFLADNNIELAYLEDINMDRAELQNMDYEDYLEKEKNDLEEITRRVR